MSMKSKSLAIVSAIPTQDNIIRTDRWPSQRERLSRLVDINDTPGLIKFELMQVPPPETARQDELGDKLGLVRGLRPRPSNSQFRCCQCHKMQPPGSHMVMVPDGVLKGDPAWAVEESCRRSTFNGSFSGWCLKCAPKRERWPSTPDMAELDYTSAKPDDTRWMLPAFALGFAVVALVGIVKFRIWETLGATWQ